MTSEVFERALRYRGSYDRSQGRAGRLAARHRAPLRRRRAGRARAAEQPVGEIAARRRRGALEEDSVRRLTLAAAIAQLATQDQELIALRFGADLTARADRRLLELQTNAVEVALHRTLARLRSILGSEEAENLGEESGTKSIARAGWKRAPCRAATGFAPG